MKLITQDTVLDFTRLVHNSHLNLEGRFLAANSKYTNIRKDAFCPVSDNEENLSFDNPYNTMGMSIEKSTPCKQFNRIITTVYLNGNRISRLYNISFAPLINLIEVDLSDNFLSTLDLTQFGLWNVDLRHFNSRRNRISVVIGNLSELVSLETLLLSDNKISRIYLVGLATFAYYHDYVIDIKNNQAILEMDCRSAEFLKTFKKKKVTSIKFDSQLKVLWEIEKHVHNELIEPEEHFIESDIDHVSYVEEINEEENIWINNDNGFESTMNDSSQFNSSYNTSDISQTYMFNFTLDTVAKIIESNAIEQRILVEAEHAKKVLERKNKYIKRQIEYNKLRKMIYNKNVRIEKLHSKYIRNNQKFIFPVLCLFDYISNINNCWKHSYDFQEYANKCKGGLIYCYYIFIICYELSIIPICLNKFVIQL